MRVPYSAGAGALVWVRLAGPNGFADVLALLDTGAEDVLVSQTRIAQLGLRPVGVIEEDTPAGLVQEPVYHAALQVGDKQIGELEVVALGGTSQADVILGRRALAHFRVTFDGPAGWVDLA